MWAFHLVSSSIVKKDCLFLLLTGCCVLSDVLVKVCPRGVGLVGIWPTGVTCGFHADMNRPPRCTVSVTLKTNKHRLKVGGRHRN